MVLKSDDMKYIIILCVFLYSCGPYGDCKPYVEALKNDECLLIVRKIPGETDGRFNYQGINPVTKKECDCNSNTSSMWWATFADHIELGDTVIKKRGEYTFNIHKRDTVLTFNVECQGKVYK